MRRISTFLALAIGCCVLTADLNAQRNSNFDEGFFQANVGLALGSTRSLSGLGAGLPLMGSVEYGILNNLGVGGFIGFARRKADFLAADLRYTFFSFGGVGTYHLGSLLEDVTDDGFPDDLDLYGSLYVGFETVSVSESTFGTDAFGSRFIFSPVLGGRYFFTDNLAAFAELGYGAIGYFTVGATFKLK